MIMPYIDKVAYTVYVLSFTSKSASDDTVLLSSCFIVPYYIAKTQVPKSTVQCCSRTAV